MTRSSVLCSAGLGTEGGGVEVVVVLVLVLVLVLVVVVVVVLWSFTEARHQIQ